MSIEIKAVKGSVLQVLTLIVNICSLFFVFPYSISILGDEVFGLWMLIAAFTGYYILLDFGVGQAVTRFVSSAVEESDRSKINSVMSNSLFVFCSIGGGVFFIGSFCLFLYDAFSGFDYKEVAVWLVFLGLIEFLVTLILRPFVGLLYANFEYAFCSFLEILKVVCRSFLVLNYLDEDRGVVFLGVVSLVSTFVYYVPLVLFALYKYNPSISFGLVSRVEVTKIFQFSKFVFISQIGDLLRFRIDFAVISYFLSLEMVTVYSIASKVSDYFSNLFIRMFTTINPYLFRKSTSLDKGHLLVVYSRSFWLSSFVVSMVAGVFVLCSKEILEVWVGSGYSVASVILIVLIAAWVTDLIQIPANTILQSLGKHHYFSYLTLAEGLLNIILSIILSLAYGVIGVALATLISMFLFKICFLPYYVCKSSGLLLAKYYMRVSVCCLLAVIAGIATIGISGFFDGGAWLLIFVKSVVFLFFYVVFSCFFVFVNNRFCIFNELKLSSTIQAFKL